MRWTTWGPISDSCGHEHRSKEAALHCLTRYRKECHNHDEYCDRFMVRGKAGLTKKASVVSGPVGLYDPHYE